MRIYLAGPMTGYPRFNMDSFCEAAERLRSFGHEVFNPIERDIADGFNPDTDQAESMAHYMAIDLPEVCRSEAVVVLPGWQASTGANIEVFVALKCGIPVLAYDSLQPIQIPPQLVSGILERPPGRPGLHLHPRDPHARIHQ